MSLFTAYSQDTNCMIIGHRGFRGVYPENTILGFQKALQIPVNGIELDVVVNRDKQLVISHEPYFNKDFCLDSTGEIIRNEKEFNMYTMTQDEIVQFDCGTKAHPKFPEQIHSKQVKPLCSALWEIKDLDSAKIILFEIKSEKDEYGVSQPYPDEFAKLVIKEASIFRYKQNIIFMSFDPEILNEISRLTNEYRMVLLTYNPLKSLKSALKELEFSPYALGMFYPTINQKVMQNLKRKNIQCFAWTVNDQIDADRLHALGIDAIITDYPDRIK